MFFSNLNTTYHSSKPITVKTTMKYKKKFSVLLKPQSNEAYPTLLTAFAT